MPPQSPEPYLFVLDATAPANGANCTALRRAFNAVQAGATGVLIIAASGTSGAALTAQIEPNTDDLLSIHHVDVPVGTLPFQRGASSWFALRAQQLAQLITTSACASVRTRCTRICSHTIQRSRSRAPHLLRTVM